MLRATQDGALMPADSIAPGSFGETDTVMLPARPEPIAVPAAKTAVIVIDMQNAYASKGGYLDLAGFDISGAAKVIANTKAVVEAARAAGMTVF
jgi:ureidoacrylate peracid hydrolase